MFSLWIAELVLCVCFKQEDVSVQLEALDILSDLLCRFGSKFALSVVILLINLTSCSTQVLEIRYILICHKQTSTNCIAVIFLFFMPSVASVAYGMLWLFCLDHVLFGP